MELLTSRQKKDLKVLINFVRIYCRSKHDDRQRAKVDVEDIVSREIFLCHDCAELVTYAQEKRRKCPLDPKPSCKRCHIHCYSREYRDRVREIMAFSGRRMIMRGRLDYIWHYLF
jgi:Nitrous oxide-stimulated promoter